MTSWNKFLLSLLLVAFIVPNAFAKKELLFAALDFCPYSCPNDRNTPGIFPEVVKTIFEKHGYEVYFDSVGINEWRDRVKLGHYDGVIGVSALDAGNLVLPTTETIYVSYQFFVKRGNKWRFNKFIDLDQIKLGVFESLKYGPKLTAYISASRYSPRVHEMKEARDLARGLRMMNDSKLDAILLDAAWFKDYTKKNGINEKNYISAGIYAKYPIYIGIMPEKPATDLYSDYLNEGLVALKASEEWITLLNKYHLKLPPTYRRQSD